MRRQALLLLGCPRSGATALAGALARAGAHVGAASAPAPAGDPAETFASLAVVALNERLLTAVGLRWDTLAPMPERWRDRPAVKALEATADAAIAAEFGTAPHVVLHDPRLCLTMPFWRDRLEAAGYAVASVLFVRRPGEVAASLARRDQFAPEKSLALWLNHLAEAERTSRGGVRTLVCYDRLLDAPAETLAHVVADTRFGLAVTGAAREAAIAQVRPDWRRQGEARGTTAAALSSGLDTALTEGYQRLAHLAPGSDPRRAVEALGQAAYAPLLQAIPPWLGQELAAGRAHAERHALELDEIQRRAASLAAELEQARSLHAVRDRTEAELRARIEALARNDHRDGRDARVDEALSALKADVARMADTLADQPAREQALRLELVQAQRDLSDERATMSRLVDDLDREREAAARLAETLATNQAHLQALAAELEQAHADHAAWEAHDRALAQELDEARAGLTALQPERDALRKERDEATRRLEKNAAELDTLRVDLRIVDNDRNALAARAQHVADAASALREELGRRAAAEAALAGERERLVADLRAATDRVAALERELAKRAADLSTIRGRYDGLAKLVTALEKRWLGRVVLKGVR